MALFFDQGWFEGKMAVAGLAKPDLARALGLTLQELQDMWKDQREISEREIKTLALLLGASEAEVRNKGGVQGSPEAHAAVAGAGASPSPETTSVEARLTRLEATLDKILQKLSGD